MTSPTDLKETPDKPASRLTRSRRRRRIILIQTGLVALLILAISLTGALLIDVRQKLSDLQSSAQDNVQWTLAQFEVEFAAFSEAVAQTRAAIAVNAPIEVSSLTRRYDILYSRIDILQQSQIYRVAFDEQDLVPEVTQVADQIRGMARIIDSDRATLVQSLPLLNDQIDRLRPQVRHIVIRGNQALTFAADTNRRDIAEVMSRLALATAFLLAVLATMVVLFRRVARISSQRLRDNLATSARLETIFSTSQDGIVVLDHNGTVISMNRAAQHLLGHSTDSVRGSRISRLLAQGPPDNLVGITGEHLFKLAASDRATGIRLTAKRPDGRTIPVEISVGASRQGDTPICVCVIHDITHQNAIEDELKTSRDQALAGERAKARFLGVVSHEMRTPLNGILGALDLIEEDKDMVTRDAIGAYLTVLRRSSDTLLTLVNDVLDITQIENGIRLNRRDFDADQLLRTLVLAETSRARGQGNTITITTNTPIGHVTGDPERLGQVIANLLTNANKFTTNGQIAIDAARLDGDLVEFQITDTGHGMTDAERARIFDDFVRLDPAIDMQIPGTGLGLGIARNLVEAMQGQIGAESEPGEGSLFWVRLPLPRAKASPRETSPGPAPRGQKNRPARVLMVEDNATNRFIARRLMENDGHIVSEALNGAEAVDLAQKAPFDIILMDISMPVMDGQTAARTIRSHAGPNRATRIVALTAHVTGGLDETQIRNAMDAVLHKPLDRAALRREIQLALGTDAGRDDTSAPDTDLHGFLLGLEPTLALPFIDRFLTETDTAITAIHRRLTGEIDGTDQADDLARALHDLGGACASFDIPDMHRILIGAEAAVRADDVAQARVGFFQAKELWPGKRAKILSIRSKLTAQSKAEDTAKT